MRTHRCPHSETSPLHKGLGCSLRRHPELSGVSLTISVLFYASATADYITKITPINFFLKVNFLILNTGTINITLFTSQKYCENQIRQNIHIILGCRLSRGEEGTGRERERLIFLKAQNDFNNNNSNKPSFLLLFLILGLA